MRAGQGSRQRESAHAREVALDCMAEALVCRSHDRNCANERVRTPFARIQLCNQRAACAAARSGCLWLRVCLRRKRTGLIIVRMYVRKHARTRDGV